MDLQKRPLNPLSLVLLLSGIFFIIFLVISGILFMSSGTKGSGKMGGALFGTGSVGVIELNGVIMDSKKMLSRLEKMDKDGEVRAVVLRLNSPGGAVAPSQEIYEAVRKFKKPLVVSMGSVAASGGFYIACGAKKVFANPGTITGSIGVIMEFANLEKLYEWAKIRRYVIKTGKFKDAGAEFREMTPEERALFQTMVDDVLVQFKTAVAEGRKLKMEQVNAIADGRIMSGSQAKAARLVDSLGGIQDAIEEAGRLAGIKGKPTVVYPEKGKRRWLDLILDDTSKEDDSQARSAGGWLSEVIQGVAGHLTGGMAGGVDPLVLQPGLYWLWTGAR